MTKILISGGSGLIGKAISKQLLKEGKEVVWLGRKSGEWNGVKIFAWDTEKKIVDLKAFESVSAIINLAGSSITDERWTEKRREDILNSRIRSVEFLAEIISKNKFSISKVIGASAIGYYGAIESESVFAEDSKPGNDFLGNLCVEWENSYKSIKELGISCSLVRTSIVLSKDGGAYPPLKKLIKSGIGSVIGSGKQMFPWIHINDIAGIYLHLLKEKESDIYNGVADEMPTTKEFTHQLAKCLNRRILLPNIPAFILKLILGSRAQMLLTGVKISNKKIKEAGYVFQYSRLSDALKEITS